MDFNRQTLVQAILFWFHLLFILSAVAIGFFLSPFLVLAFVVLHRIHTVVFRECVLSKIQRRMNGLPSGVNFLQFAVKRFFKKDISASQSQALDYSFVGLALVIALIK